MDTVFFKIASLCGGNIHGGPWGAGEPGRVSTLAVKDDVLSDIYTDRKGWKTSHTLF